MVMLEIVCVASTLIGFLFPRDPLFILASADRGEHSIINLQHYDNRMRSVYHSALP